MSYELIDIGLWGFAGGLLVAIALTYDRLKGMILDSLTFMLFLTAGLLTYVGWLDGGSIGTVYDHMWGAIVVGISLYIAFFFLAKRKLLGFGSVKLGFAIGLLLGLSSGIIALVLWSFITAVYLLAMKWPKDAEIVARYRGAFWLLAVVLSVALTLR